MRDLLPKIQSDDGLFHNGNPSTGEQGTRVTDKWLNDVQEHVRDFGDEFKYLLQQAELEPNSAKKTQIYDAISKIINDKRRTATTTQAGEVQLDSSTNSDSEDKAATPKAIKQIKDLVENRTGSLDFIPNSHKSNNIDSNSEDNVATSKAIKLVKDIADTKAPLISPALTGTPTAPTANQSTNNTQIATTAFVKAAIAALVGSAPSSLDTLNELATALNNNANFASTIVNQLSQKADKNILDALVGIPLPWMQANLPSLNGVTVLALNGQRFDKGRYPILAQRYPSGVLIDLRGEFIRGWDNGRNIDSGRQVLSYQEDNFKRHTHRLKSTGSDGYTNYGANKIYTVSNRGGWRDADAAVDFINETGGNETRPRNVAFQYICIAA